MKRVLSRISLVALAALVIALAGRLCWVAWRAEIGGETIAATWMEALLAWFGKEPNTVVDQWPAEQADFWVAEVDRVLAAHPADAELTMAAAWLLDVPSMRFVRKIVEPPMRGIGEGRYANEVIGEKMREFEAGCSGRCIELATRAVTLAPENSDLWRQYALLLFQGDHHGLSFGPRCQDYLQRLEACARHDPQNALYDFLAADAIWSQAATVEWDGTAERMEVKDAVAFAKGVSRLESGLQQPFLEFPQSALRGVQMFLQQTNLPRTVAVRVTFGRWFEMRQLSLLSHLARWQNRRAFQASRDGDPKQAIAYQRQWEQVLDQFQAGKASAPGWYAAVRFARMRLGNVETTLELTTRYPRLLTREEVSRLQQAARDLRVEERLISYAEQRVQNRSTGEDSPGYKGSVMAMVYAQRGVLALVVLGAVLVPLIRLVRGGRRPLTESSRAGHLGFILASFTLTFLLLGMFPAGVIGPDAQQATAFGLSLVIVLPALVFLWRSCRRLLGRFQSAAVRLPMLALLTVVTVWQAAVASFVVLNRCLIEAAIDWFRVQVLIRMLDWSLVVLAILLGVCVVRLVWRRRHGGKPLVTAATVTAGLLLVTALLVVSAVCVCPGVLDARDLIPQRGESEFRFRTLLDDLGVYAPGTWRWAVRQWIAYGGTYAAPIGAMALATLWVTLCHFRQPSSDAERPKRGRWRLYCGSVLSCIRRSAWVQAGCLLIVYLAVAPRAVEQAEATYQFHRRCIDAPETYRSAVMTEADALRSDPTTMQEIRAEVEEEMSRRWTGSF